MKITKTQLKQIIKEEISRVLLKESKGKVLNRAEWKELLDRVKSKKQKTMSRDWTDRSREAATDKDVAAVEAWLSTSGYEDAKVFDGTDPEWETQASDKDFLILGQATSGDFDYHTMKAGAPPINLVFIKSRGEKTEPVYAYVRY